MLVKQISVFVENKFGKLADIIDLLGSNDIDISALSMADTTDFGILRAIVSDPVRAEELLKENGIAAKITDVLAVAVEDKPGGLAEILLELKKNDIGIEYMYAFMGSGGEHSGWSVIRVDKTQEAVKILENAMVKVLNARHVHRFN